MKLGQPIGESVQFVKRVTGRELSLGRGEAGRPSSRVTRFDREPARPKIVENGVVVRNGAF